ncbi:MAG: hypothetical protein ACI81S_001196 [Sphingobacteriales bacterium]|jgi:hypothetical protein
MLTRLFNNSQPYTILILFGFLLLIRIPMFFAGINPPIETMAEPLGNFMFLLNGSVFYFSWINLLLALFLLLLQALFFNKITNEYNFYPRTTYIPGLVYGLVLSLFPQYLFLSPFLILNFFVLLVLQKIFSLYKSNTPIQALFDIGFLIGIASLFYFPIVWMLLVTIIAIGYLRPPAWREWISLILGFLLAFVFCWFIYFWIDQAKGFWTIFSSFGVNQSFFRGEFPWDKFSMMVIIPILLLLVMAVNNFFKTFVKTVIVVRKYFQVLMVMFVVGLLSFFLSKDNSLYHFSWVAIPIAFILTNYFQRSTKLWLSESLLMVVTVALISLQLF